MSNCQHKKLSTQLLSKAAAQHANQLNKCDGKLYAPSQIEETAVWRPIQRKSVQQLHQIEKQVHLSLRQIPQKLSGKKNLIVRSN
jgi:hypothetical protein